MPAAKGTNKPVANGNRPNSSTGVSTLLTLLIIIAVLHFARTVFIPLSLAVLLAFLLGPLVIRLRHWSWKRVPAAVAAVLVSFFILGGIGMLMAAQLSDLAHKLPEYQQIIHRKVEKIRNSGGGLVSRVTGWMRNFTEEQNPPAPPAERNQPPNERPVPVEMALRRKQNRYHPRWREIHDETKYARMVAFGSALPRIRKRVKKDLTQAGLPRCKLLATV